MENFNQLVEQINKAERKSKNIIWMTAISVVVILISSIFYIKNQERKFLISYEIKITRVNNLLDSINNNIEKLDSLGILLIETEKIDDSISIRKSMNQISDLEIEKQLDKLENLEIESEEQKRLNRKLAGNYRDLIKSSEERFEKSKKANEELIQNPNALLSNRDFLDEILMLQLELKRVKNQHYYFESEIGEVYADLKRITLLLEKIESYNFKKSDRELERLRDELQRTMFKLRKISK